MKIAFISFEFPPDTASGGIATYVNQVSLMMKKRGHEVHVFCGSEFREIKENINGVIVHRIKTDRYSFPEKVVGCFTKIHKSLKFDVIESPEFSGDGYYIKNKNPEIPLIVKLHTPWFLIYKLNHHYISFYKKIKFIIWGILGKNYLKPYWRYKNQDEDLDFKITLIADQIHTPSISLGDIVSKKWNIPRKKIRNVPYPFIPNNDLLNIPIETTNNTISFIGRLETRKGIIELVKSLPTVFKTYSNLKFKFIGKSADFINTGELMENYIKRNLSEYLHQIEFIEFKSQDIYNAYLYSDICVFPSLWENFPNVCLEAMSAGRAIIGSKNGGMKDMLEKSNSGILINPYKPKEISAAIITLIKNKDLRFRLGKNARKVVLEKYNQEVIGNLMEDFYFEAINK